MSIHQPKAIPPKQPVPKNYVPTGSRPYEVNKIKRNESWASIAIDNGLDPLWLIQYNFETRNPDEINWYLKNHKGCGKTTPSGRNFVFSGGETIYLPVTKPGLDSSGLTFYSYGITVGGDDDYKNAVKPVLNHIVKSETGRVLFSGIQRTGKTVTIVPFEGTDCNAFAAPNDWNDATPAGEYALDGTSKPLKDESVLGHWLRDRLDLPHPPLVGTGRGSDVTVQFTPSIFGYGSTGPCGFAPGQAGATPSQVLFHELSHAYRQASGRLFTRQMIGSGARYDNKEEFFAIVLTNIFITDPTNPTASRALRADHQDFTPLAAGQSTSKSFISTTSNRNHVRELFKEEPLLMNDLLRVSSYFNPFAEAL